MPELHGVDPTTQPRAARLYLPQLDAMRFFAFLSVFFFHGLPSNDIGVHTGTARTIATAEAAFHRSLENGVGLFFLLSAYLIAELLRRERALTGSIHLARFYFRRSLRIWPLYYLAVVLGLILSHLSPEFYISRAGMFAYVFFWKNWDLALHGATWNPIYVLWTVSAEEQFYAVWPLAQKHVRSRVLLAGCVLAIFAIGYAAFRPWGYFFRTSNSQIVYLFLYFPLGALLAFGLRGRQYLAPARWCVSLAAAGVLFWLGGTFLSYPNHEMPGPFSWFLAGRTAVVAGTLCIFLSFYLSAPSWWPKVPVYLGRISYGLYVFHVAALLVAIDICHRLGLLLTRTTFTALAAGLALKLTIAFAFTVAVAIVSYELYEKRFLALKDRLAFVRSGAGSLATASTPGPDREEGAPGNRSRPVSTPR